jgi:hypothetical protein
MVYTRCAGAESQKIFRKAFNARLKEAAEKRFSGRSVLI